MPQTEIRSFDPLTLLAVADERLNFLAPDKDELDLLTYLLGLPEEEICPIRGARDFCRPYLKQQLYRLYRADNLILTNRLVTALIGCQGYGYKASWQRIPYLSYLISEVQMLILCIFFWRRHGLGIKVAPIEDYDQDRLDRLLTLTYLSTVTADDVEEVCNDIFSRITGASA